MPCPACGGRIVVPIQQLLAGSVTCPSCNLVLRIDAAQSRDTLDELRKLDSRLSTVSKPAGLL
jgi:uncharacterized protein YbaR (Trm112 family)